MEFLYITVGVLLFVSVILLIVRQREKARSAQLEVVSDELGLQFQSEGNPEIQDLHNHFRLFDQGHARKNRNVMSGQTENVGITIFEYRYTTGGGKNQETHQQTLISFHSPTLSLPKFELRPENLFHKIGQMFGYKDIDFDTHPLFSKRYLLRGQDEDAVRELFTSEVLEFFESQKKVSVEAAGDRLIYFRAGKRIKPNQTRQFMEEGFRIYSLFHQVSD